MADWDSGNTGPGNPAAPAGWYPVDGAMQRYWDGASWTEHTAPLAAPPSAPTIPPHAPAPWVDGAPAGQPAANPGAIPPQQGQPFASPGGGIPFGGPPGSFGSAPGAYAVPPGAYAVPPGAYAVPPGAYAVPPGAYAVPPPATADDRTIALLIHLLSLVSLFVGPLILWLVKRDESSFVDHHGKEALNFQLSLLVYWAGTLLSMLFLIGFLLFPVLFVFQFVAPIIAAVSANQGRYYRHPLTLRIIT